MVYNTHMQTFTQFDDRLSALWQTALSKETVAMPFYTFAWHRHWHTILDQTEKLLLIAHDGLIFPLAIRENVAHFTGGEEIADYLDALGDNATKANAWKNVLSFLKEQGATSLILRNIPGTSETLTFFKHMDTEITEEDTTPTITLAASWEAYLSSLGRKERHELRRKMRRFEEQHAALSFIQASPIDMELLLRLMKEDPDKKQFLTGEMEQFFRGLPEAAGDQLLQFVLQKDGQPIATTLVFRVNQSLLLYNSGYDHTIEGSGLYLKIKLVEWAIANNMTHVNFLQGGERYKYDLGAVDSPIYRVSVTLR